MKSTIVIFGLLASTAFLPLAVAQGAKDLFLLPDASTANATPATIAKTRPAAKQQQVAAVDENAGKVKASTPVKPSALEQRTLEPKPTANIQVASTPPALPADQQYMGLSYWIELHGENGDTTRAPVTRAFKSGERIKLNLKANRDGYLYVVSLGSTGRTSIIYPRGVDNGMKAGKVYTIPESGVMRFDDNPGEEQLLVMLSAQPVADFSPETFKPELNKTQNMVAYASRKGAKDLLIEDDAPKGKPYNAGYAVAPLATIAEGKTINLAIKLKHVK